MMWFLLLLLYIAHTEQVTIEGDNPKRLILADGNDPCEGYVQIYSGNSWGYLGDKYWNSNTEKVVCRSIHCGEPVEDATDDVIRLTDNQVWLNEVKCDGHENHLWDCDFPGWNISFYRKMTVKKMKCSHKIKIDLDGFECAGAVQYYTDGKTPSGYFCADNWGLAEANHLCTSLNCGKSAEIPEQEWMVWKRFKDSKKMMINCPAKQLINNLWQCATQESPSCQKPASVICKDYKRLQLRGNTSNVCSGLLEIEENNSWKPFKNITDSWCNQMYCGEYDTHSQSDNGIQLDCSDKVKVVLMDNGHKPSKCYGNVHITINDNNHPVCGSYWTDENAKMVCRELNCGTLIESRNNTNSVKGIMNNVNCTGKESSLWHCRAMRDKQLLPCSSNAYVVCSESLGARLVDGPGKCAGRVEIMHEGQWKKVDKKQWTKTNSDTVCKQLKCGNARKSASSENFSPGLSDFLQKTVTCTSSASNISMCSIGDLNNSIDKKEALGITCEEHKVLFLKGSSCSGKVFIEHGDNNYWLSGSKQTWNRESASTVCRQMLCGRARNFNYTIPDATNAVSKKSYSCSSNTTSLFDCEKDTLPSDHNYTVATVRCSGEIKMNLTNGCWGNVNICVERKCGGVCADTWTDSKSEKLCKQLGCGYKNLPAYSQPKASQVIFKSVHTLKTEDLTKCNFVKNNDNTCNQNPAYVVCSDSIKVKLEMLRDKCSGNVKVYYEGQWLPVCKNALDDKGAQNIICEEMGCGPADSSIDYFGSTVDNEQQVISQLQCPEHDKSLTSCNISIAKLPCPLGGLQCSNWKKIAISEACSGAVYLQSEGKNPTAISVEGFSGLEGDMLCQNLNCASFKSKGEKKMDSLWASTLNCTGVQNPYTVWDCEKPQAPTQKKQLLIECQGDPKVTLSEKCYGKVRIDDIQVCNSQWNTEYSNMVCQEHNCSNAIGGELTGEKPVPGSLYYHVRCEDYHYKLGQCKRFKQTCNGQLVSVYCVGNIKFNTTEKCGGQVEINYRNKWDKGCLSSEVSKDMLCKSLGCSNSSKEARLGKNKNKKALNMTLHCEKNHRHIKHCVLHRPCVTDDSTEIYCPDYKKKEITVTPDKKISVVSIILGVGLFLALVILIVVVVRIYIVRRDKNVSLSDFSRKEVEFESGEYEDVPDKENEMEDVRGRFISEAEMITEHDAQSASSLPYDDIDEADEARPLTSQADTAGASGDNYIQSSLDQSTDGVTYEVEDPEENYDDIEASPVITQTQAEVHDGPNATPESDAVAPPGLVQDEDYLVPGQDG